MKTKKLFIAVCIIVCCLPPASYSFSQSSTYLWAQRAGGSDDDEGYNSCSTDPNGNIIMAGSFASSSITFGITTLSHTSGSGDDMFVVKYDPNGNVLWAKSNGGNSDDRIISCSADVSGNIIVAGSFLSPSITFGTTTLNNTGGYDLFIVKYDPSGNVLWAKSAGGINDEGGQGRCSIDANGNIIVAGSFASPTITFGTTTLNNTGNFNDVFIVRYDPNGNVIWAQRAGGSDDDEGYSCSTDAGGNTIVAGSFASPSITFGTTTLNRVGGRDIFIVKYNSTGNVLWAKSNGGISADVIMSCSIDTSENIIVTGAFMSPSINFGTTTLVNADNTASTWDIFIVKYDPNGNVFWAKNAGGSGDDFGFSCSSDINGNVIAAGMFISPSIIFGTTSITNAGYWDMFIVKYDPNGNVLWAESNGGANIEAIYNCVTDANSNIIATGNFQSPSIAFGTTTLSNASNDDADIFIVKFNGFTGLAEIMYTEVQSVYPNPTSGKFRLSLPLSFREGTVEVYSIIGEKIFSSPIRGGWEGALDLSSQPNGIYFLNISSESKSVNQKIIIQK